MRALLWNGPSVMELGSIPEPEPRDGEAVVAVELSGICGSDVAAYRGTMGIARPGDVRGHEVAGVVTAVGSPRDAGWVGARAAVNSQVSCGACWACAAGTDNLCPRLRILGVHLPGGFAERVVVPVRNLARVPAHVGPELAAMAEPLAQACHDVRLALLRDPGSMLVLGAGSIGRLVVQAADLLGIDEVTVVEPVPERRADALAAGASAAVSSAAEARELAAGRPRGGFDVVVDAVGTLETRAVAVELVRAGGQVVLVGLHTDVTPLAWFPVIRREVTLTGANCFDRGDFEQAVEWLEAGCIGGPGRVRSAPLEEGPRLFAELAAGSTSTAKVLLSPGAA